MALGTSKREVVWIMNILLDIMKVKTKARVLCDNTAMVKVATDLHLTKRLHYVARGYYQVNEQIYNGNVEVICIGTTKTQQHADILTKALGNNLSDMFKQLLDMGWIVQV